MNKSCHDISVQGWFQPIWTCRMISIYFMIIIFNRNTTRKQRLMTAIPFSLDIVFITCCINSVTISANILDYSTMMGIDNEINDSCNYFCNGASLAFSITRAWCPSTVWRYLTCEISWQRASWKDEWGANQINDFYFICARSGNQREATWGRKFSRFLL